MQNFPQNRGNRRGRGEGEQESPHHFKSSKHLHNARDGMGGKGFCKFPENEGRGRGVGGRKHPTLFKSYRHHVNAREGGGFKWKILGEFATRNCFLVNYYSK